MKLIEEKDYYGLKKEEIGKMNGIILFGVMNQSLNYLKEMVTNGFGGNHMKNMI